MAINPNSSFPTKTTAPDADYPYGGAQDITVTGDGTGTPWVALLVNDIFGFQQALLNAASIVPSGSPDTILASDYLDAVDIIKARLANAQKLVGRNFADTLYYDLIGLNVSDEVEIGSSAVSSIKMFADMKFTVANPNIVGNDSDGVLSLASGLSSTSGSRILMFGPTHATKAFDFEVRSDAFVRLHYDNSISLWDFQVNDILTEGKIGINESPDCPLLVVGPSSVGGHLTPAATTMATFKNRGVGGSFISLIADTGEATGVNFGTNGDEDDGSISYVANIDRMSFRAGAAVRMTMITGLQIGAAVGGDPGAGKLNAEDVEVNGNPVLVSTDNLSDLDNAATSRTNLGVKAEVETQQNASSGTTVAFTGLPSNVTKIEIGFDRVTSTSSDELRLRLGTGGGPTFVATGYDGAAQSSGASLANSVALAFALNVSSGAADEWSGNVTLTKMSDNVWTIAGVLTEKVNASGGVSVGGRVSLPAVLTGLEFSLTGGSSFDGAGRIMVRYMT